METDTRSGGPPDAKLKVRLRAVGSAPPLERKLVKLDGHLTIYEVERRIRKQLNCADQALFLYCGGGFSPTPDQKLEDLFDCFKTGDELSIMYALKESWG